MKNVLAATALAAAALAVTAPASVAGTTVCLPESPAADGCVTAYLEPGHYCVAGNVTVAGVPLVRQPCR